MKRLIFLLVSVGLPLLGYAQTAFYTETWPGSSLNTSAWTKASWSNNIWINNGTMGDVSGSGSGAVFYNHPPPITRSNPSSRAIGDTPAICIFSFLNTCAGTPQPEAGMKFGSTAIPVATARISGAHWRSSVRPRECWRPRWFRAPANIAGPTR